MTDELKPDGCAIQLYSSYFKLHVRWVRSLTRITYYSKLIGIFSLATFLQLELFRVYLASFSYWRKSAQLSIR